MGDLNTGYYQPSQKLLRTGAVEAYGRHWEVPMTFVDAWAQLHPEDPAPQSRRRGVVVGRGFSGAFGSGWKWKCFSTVRVWKWRAALPLAVFFLGESCVDFVRNNGGS